MNKVTFTERGYDCLSQAMKELQTDSPAPAPLKPMRRLKTTASRDLDLDIRRERVGEHHKKYLLFTERFMTKRESREKEKSRPIDVNSFRVRLREHDSMITKRNQILAHNQQVRQQMSRVLAMRKYGTVWGRFRL